MDPFVVFDCQQILPNRYALALAAAARSRALLRGARPRLERPSGAVSEVALHEIAGRMFTRDELVPFLSARRASSSFLHPPQARALRRRLRVGRRRIRFPPGETVIDDATHTKGEVHGEASDRQ